MDVSSVRIFAFLLPSSSFTHTLLIGFDSIENNAGLSACSLCSSSGSPAAAATASMMVVVVDPLLIPWLWSGASVQEEEQFYLSTGEGRVHKNQYWYWCKRVLSLNIMINGREEVVQEEDEEANKTHNTDMRVRSHLLNERRRTDRSAIEWEWKGWIVAKDDKMMVMRNGILPWARNYPSCPWLGPLSKWDWLVEGNEQLVGNPIYQPTIEEVVMMRI